MGLDLAQTINSELPTIMCCVLQVHQAMWNSVASHKEFMIILLKI